MNEIKCPHCGKTFKVDESDYSKLLNQIKNDEFYKEVERAKEVANKNYELAIKDLEVKNKEQASSYEIKIQQLQSKIENFDSEKEMEKMKIAGEKDKEIDALKGTIKAKDDEIAHVKEMKAKLSTKMIGESLEQFCWSEFERVRPLLPPSVYFEKDNDSSEGSKGDFIYREKNENGELFSIMFEMKNENDETATKHKNEDFFKKLDKDRIDKKCEFAVLVSTLEADSDVYNAGIVDVSHRYEKMYVVRPQCFIPIITLLRNACLKSSEYKSELDIYKSQNYDFEEFEERMNKFKDGFNKNYELATRKFDEAINNIETTIKNLEKVRDNLLSSQKQLRYADDKISSFDIKKIAKGNKTITAILDSKVKKTN